MGPEGNGLWELVLLADSLDYFMDAAIGAQEPAFSRKVRIPVSPESESFAQVEASRLPTFGNHVFFRKADAPS